MSYINKVKPSQKTFDLHNTIRVRVSYSLNPDLGPSCLQNKNPESMNSLLKFTGRKGLHFCGLYVWFFSF